MKKIYLFLVLMVVLCNLVQASQIDLFNEVNENYIQFDQWQEYTILDKEGNSFTEIGIRFNFTDLPNKEEITFDITPLWHLRHEKAKIEYINLTICEGKMYRGGYKIELSCDKEPLKPREETYISATEDLYGKNITTYKYILDTNSFEKNKWYSIKINYSISNFVIKQGEYRIAWFRDDWGKNRRSDIDRYVILPKDALLEKMPDDAGFDMSTFTEQWMIWDFELGNNQIRYIDVSWWERNKGGFLWGLLFGLIPAIIGIIIGFLLTRRFNKSKTNSKKEKIKLSMVPKEIKSEQKEILLIILAAFMGASMSVIFNTFVENIKEMLPNLNILVLITNLIIFIASSVFVIFLLVLMYNWFLQKITWKKYFMIMYLTLFLPTTLLIHRFITKSTVFFNIWWGLLFAIPINYIFINKYYRKGKIELLVVSILGVIAGIIINFNRNIFISYILLIFIFSDIIYPKIRKIKRRYY